MINIPRKELNDGSHIPIIGLGLAQIPATEVSDLVYTALKKGYRQFDSAAIYKNERGVCEGIAKWIKEDPGNNKRSDVWYTTKIFETEHGYEKTKNAIRVCLENAKTIGYIDMILVHSARSNWERRHGTWIALQEAVESGFVKTIGVSNYALKHVQELLEYKDLKIKPAVDQVELHPWLMREELVTYLQKNKIAPEAYSPLTRGMWLDDPTLVRIARKHNKSPAQILINWSLSKGFICLPRTSKPKRLDSNLEVFDFQLDREDLDLIEKRGEAHPTKKDSTDYPLDSEKTEEQLKREQESLKQNQ